MSDLETRELERRVLTGDVSALPFLQRAWKRTEAAESLAKVTLVAPSPGLRAHVRLEFLAVQDLLTADGEFMWEAIHRSITTTRSIPPYPQV